jgi:hypothetical protein
MARLPHTLPVDLATLCRLAAEYEAIEPGAAYPPAEFVDFLRAELVGIAEQRLEYRREANREKMRRWRARARTAGG